MRLSRLWIRLNSLLVPGVKRAEWVEEWQAELAVSGAPLHHLLGALPDAWYLRTEGWTMDRILQDARTAIKGLLRRPFFTALAGITLAIGIGANTAIFSVVDSVLLNPLPYPDSDEILSVNHTAPGIGIPMVPQSQGSYLHYLQHLQTLESFAAWYDAPVNLVSGDDPRRLDAGAVTREFFDVMGVQPFLGRGFADGEDRGGADPVVVLGHALWKQSFGGNPDLVGKTVELSGIQRRVVGIMPGGFDFPQDADLWIPMRINDVEVDFGGFGIIGIGRMAEGESVNSVQAEMVRIMGQMFDSQPDEFPRDQMEQAGLAPDVKPLKDLYVEDLSQALWILLGTVGFVLLIGCANVANLFLVRAEARRREHALRSALGAGRGDMIRYYLSESVALGVGGGLLGLGLAWGGVKLLLAMAPQGLPRTEEIGIDGTVLLFTGCISIGAGLFFGLFPALLSGRRDLSGMLKEGGRSATEGRERHRVRSTLVVGQVALALVLLVWPNEPWVIGRRIRSRGSPENTWEVVGVAEDIHFETLTADPGPIAYFPMIAGSTESPEITRSAAAVLHVGADPLSFVAAAREALRDVDPRLPMVNPRTVVRIEADAMAATSFTGVLLGIAAGIALLLGTVGIYGSAPPIPSPTPARRWGWPWWPSWQPGSRPGGHRGSTWWRPSKQSEGKASPVNDPPLLSPRT